MNINLIRNKIYGLLLLDTLKKKSGKNEYIELDDVMVKITSQRYEVFKKSNVCSECGLEATFLASERDELVDTDKYHINMYAILDGKEIGFTKDHIKPKSKGGKNHISNYQTMCTTCNVEKSDNY